MDPNLQDYYMKNEFCFQVDSNDNILGTLSKYDSHRIDPSTAKSPLHRAFSLFLISPDASQLLLQQRSDQKITFPLSWSNTCCSHPIAGIGEDTDDIISGVVKAARRKLQHELGIPIELTEKKAIYHCGRILYHANQDPWGEHELDHILLMFSDEEMINSLNVNHSEVKSIKFVNISDLKSLDPSTLTPWFQKILSTDMLTDWINTTTLVDGNCGIKVTKFTTEPIINL